LPGGKGHAGSRGRRCRACSGAGRRRGESAAELAEALRPGLGVAAVPTISLGAVAWRLTRLGRVALRSWSPRSTWSPQSRHARPGEPTVPRGHVFLERIGALVSGAVPNSSCSLAWDRWRTRSSAPISAAHAMAPAPIPRNGAGIRTA